MKKYFLLSFVLVVLCLANVFAKEKLQVATIPDLKPYVFVNEKNELDGFDVDFMRAVSKHMNVEPSFNLMKWEAVLPAVQNGQMDVAISSIRATESRKKKVSFSDGYTPKEDYTVIAVRVDNDKIKTFDDLKGKKVTAAIGTFQYEWAEKNLTNSKLSAAESHDMEFLELKNKKVDAAVLPELVVQAFMEKEKTVKIASTPRIPVVDMAIVTQKDNKKMLDRLNKAIAEVKKSGEYQKLVKKWFKK